jgi:PIN domain nuclease of toxin-antitoxin system
VPVVLDASAIIAFLRDEPGAQVVADHLRDERQRSFAHALNLCEVYYDFFRADGRRTAEAALDDVLALGIQERNDMEPDFWRAVGRLKAVHRRVSLADCCALALASRLGAVLISSDRHELESLVPMAICEIRFIR